MTAADREVVRRWRPAPVVPLTHCSILQIGLPSCSAAREWLTCSHNKSTAQGANLGKLQNASQAPCGTSRGGLSHLQHLQQLPLSEAMHCNAIAGVGKPSAAVRYAELTCM